MLTLDSEKAAMLGWSCATLGLALALAACGPDDGLGEESSAVTTRKGVDYSWYRPSPSSLAAQGYTFAARYLSHDTTGKNLSKAEADALIAAGLDVVSNWEQSATDALSGYSQGVSDAQAAQSQALADGAPSTRPIFFSVDFDATPAQQTPINSYFDGVASVLGVARTGAYGGFYVVQRLFDAGKITYGWQTYAWSGGQWEPRAQVRQTQNGIAGGEMDLDEAVADDFGQWGHTAPPADEPKGYLDQATCALVSGWAQDPQVPTTAIFTDVYYNAPAGGAGAVGVRLTASISRADLCSAIGSCDHGFSMTTPRGLMDGQAHAVYAYGINYTTGGTNTLLTGSPKSLTCAAPAIDAGSVKRHVTSPVILTDWKFDTFRDMAPYTAAELAAVPDGVDLGSAPDVVQVSGDPAIYVADQSFKRHIVSPDSFAAWRLTDADVKAITAADLAALTAGPDWPTEPLLAKDPSDPAVYMLDSPLPTVGPDAGEESASPDAGNVAEAADSGAGIDDNADAGGSVDGGIEKVLDAGGSPGARTPGSVGSAEGCSASGASPSPGANWLAAAGAALLLAGKKRRR